MVGNGSRVLLLHWRSVLHDWNCCIEHRRLCGHRGRDWFGLLARDRGSHELDDGASSARAARTLIRQERKAAILAFVEVGQEVERLAESRFQGQEIANATASTDRMWVLLRSLISSRRLSCEPRRPRMPGAQ